MVAEAPSVHTYQATRPYLFSVAYRMTGSASDAEDLVQEAWVRYLDAGAPDVGSLRAYLTTIISRLSIDYLKSARVRREQYVGPWMAEPVLTREIVPGPDEHAELREDVSIALVTLLERLSPEQRIVYVLREAFDLPYEEIAGHIGKSAAACRQIFHRAETRLAGEQRVPIISPTEHKAITERFLAAFTSGNTQEIANLLAPNVEWLSDAGAQRLAARRHIAGADRVSRGLAGIVQKWLDRMPFAFDIEDINGSPAIVIRFEGNIERVLTLDIENGTIRTVRLLLNPDKLKHLAASLDGEVATIEAYFRRDHALSAPS